MSTAASSPVAAAPRRPRRVTAFVVGLVAMLAAAVPAPGASERELSLDEMVALADDIVVGRVLRSEAQWRGKLIVTVSTVAVDEALKGTPRGEVAITQLGGTTVHPRLGVPVTMSVSEEAALSPGEAVVLFVRQTQPGTRQLVGGAQGKLLVRPDPVSGVSTVPGAAHDLLVRRDGGKRTIETTAPTLDTVRDRIRAAVTRQAQAEKGTSR